MNRGRLELAVVLLGACAAAWASRLMWPGVVRGGHELRLHSADPSDPFPLDGRRRIFETRARRVAEGGLVYETAARGHEVLEDGREYVVVETSVKWGQSGDGRIVSREWLRREPEALLCGRRQEGPLVSNLVPAQPVARFPVVVGARWSWSGRAGTREYRMECVVAACERVTVGAGTFEDAWRIDSEVHAISGDDSVRRSLWLQPGLGVVEERSRFVMAGHVLDLDATLLRAE